MQYRRKSSFRLHQKGLALVMVLWFIALLSILALGFSKSTRSDINITRNLLDAARAGHLAEAAIEKGIHLLLSPDQGALESLFLGNPASFRLEGVTLTYWIQDENGKVDINQAPAELIEGLLRSIEVTETDAIRDALLDWRDADDLQLLKGAESREYREAGREMMPTNVPFRDIAELQHVLGITPGLYQKLAPHITVHSSSNGINPDVASREVLMALPGVNRSEVDDMILARKEVPEDQPQPVIPSLSGVSNWVSETIGPVYTLRGLAALPSGALAARKRIIWIPDEQGDTPYYVLNSGPDDSRELSEDLVRETTE